MTTDADTYPTAYMLGGDCECKDSRSAKSLHGGASFTFHVTKYTLKHDLQTNTAYQHLVTRNF